ncbi:MAG TPA: substrate-binding domain-containing protein [Lacipirellulaceae bacterium]|nr:substrate-binding domain-containing protein [Lacipirellulaceae bacterium]
MTDKLGGMSSISLDIPSPQHLAKKLEQDIYRRGLVPDEKYLSTRQVGQRFGVSLSMAAQAMQLLVEERKLVRRDRSGTYVGPGAQVDRTLRVKVVYVLMPEERANYSVVPLDLLIDALSHPAHDRSSSTENFSVQLSFLPKEEEVRYLRKLMVPTTSNWDLCGVVAISCSREIYRFLNRESIPTVVLGSLDHDLQALPSIDADHFECGRLLAKYLFDKGHERIALLGISNGRPGDHDFLDGIVEAMTIAGKPPNSLIARLCPNDLDTLRVQAEATLSGSNRPTGIVCRGQRMLHLVLPIVSQLGLKVPEDVELVYETFLTPQIGHLPFPCAQTSEPFERIAQQIGSMLREIRAGNTLKDRHLKIPVQLRVAPGSSGTGR